jgi:hypothetical protein
MAATTVLRTSQCHIGIATDAVWGLHKAAPARELEHHIQNAPGDLPFKTFQAEVKFLRSWFAVASSNGSDSYRFKRLSSAQ